MRSDPEELATLARIAVREALATLPPKERLAYTLAEAAALCGLPKSTLRDAHSRGEFRAVLRCRKWLVTRDELVRWLSDT